MGAGLRFRLFPTQRYCTVRVPGAHSCNPSARGELYTHMHIRMKSLAAVSNAIPPPPRPRINSSARNCLGKQLASVIADQTSRRAPIAITATCLGNPALWRPVAPPVSRPTRHPLPANAESQRARERRTDRARRLLLRDRLAELGSKVDGFGAGEAPCVVPCLRIDP